MNLTSFVIGKGELGFLLVLLLGHRNIIHDQELASTLLASLSGHEDRIEQCRCADTRFLFAMRADAVLQDCLPLTWAQHEGKNAQTAVGAIGGNQIVDLLTSRSLHHPALPRRSAHATLLSVMPERSFIY